MRVSSRAGAAVPSNRNRGKHACQPRSWQRAPRADTPTGAAHLLGPLGAGKECWIWIIGFAHGSYRNDCSFNFGDRAGGSARQAGGSRART